jgi:signal transduction histidine kinase
MKLTPSMPPIPPIGRDHAVPAAKDQPECLVARRAGPYHPNMARKIRLIAPTMTGLGLGLLSAAPAYADDGLAVGSGGLIGLAIAAIVIVLLVLRAGIDRKRIAGLEARLAASVAEGDAWRNLLDIVPYPVWRHGADKEIAYRNRVFADLLQQESGHARALARGLAERALGTQSEQTESLQTVVDGQPRLYSFVLRPMGEGVGAYAVDHTALEALQSDLSGQIAATSEVLETLRTAIAIYGPERRLHFANAAFAELWKLDRNFLDGEPTIQEVLEALRERRRLPEYADFPAFKRTQVGLFQSLTDRFEELVHLPDETTLRMVVTPHPFGGLMFTYEDVTDSLALERSYNTLIDVQRATLDNLHEGVAAFGTDGRLKLFNPALVRIWELDEETLGNGPGLGELIDGAHRFFPSAEGWAEHKTEILRELPMRLSRHGILEREDGKHLDYTSVPLPDGATLLTFVDVTDRERVERALRERNDALENADRLKTEFIANVSYELRTPLNSIIGFAEILANQYFGELSSRQLEYAQGILESSQRLLSLINDILDLATIEAGYMVLEVTEVDLHGLLAGVLALGRQRARTQQLTLVFDCHPSIGSIEADPRRLKQALFNLMTNACSFTPPGGSVTLAARREQGEVAITVSDTGIGIAEKDRGRVFDRFERGVMFSSEGGAGLGLSLVKSFIELHGGRVELNSMSGEGTSVTCYLPERAVQSADRAIAVKDEPIARP